MTTPSKTPLPLSKVAMRIQALELQLAATQRQLAAAVESVPDTWLDTLLTGPDKVVKHLPYNGTDIERLLSAIRERMKARIEAAKEGK